MSEGEGVQREDAVTDRVLTVPNVISFVRLLMAPIALGLLLTGNDIAAALLFGVSAATDFIDGQIAYRSFPVVVIRKNDLPNQCSILIQTYCKAVRPQAIAVVIIGWMKNQSGPRTVCLYTVTISRFISMAHKSRYRHSSRKSIENRLS